VREIRRAGRRLGYRGMLVAFGIATVTLLAASSTGSAHATRVIQLKGHGPRVLPHLRVTAPSTMFWTNSGSFFQISSSGGYCNEGAVTSEAHRGTSYIPSGHYQDLSVRAIGDWTITIRTGVERVGNPITFSGSGQEALAPFRLSRGKTMYWTNTGTIFQTYLAEPAKAGTISSQYHRGQMRLPAGRYRFYVNATEPEQPVGHWRIVIR
jgi:hypothetical protein